MGKDNRARRAAKAKKRDRAQRGPQGEAARSAGGQRASGRPSSADGGAPQGAGPADHDALRQALVVAARAQRGKSPVAGQAIARLADADQPALLRAAEALLLEIVASAWEGGWQPAELHRQARRATANATAARAVHEAIVADDAQRRATTLDARWMAQIAQLELLPSNGRAGWLRRWRDAAGLVAPEVARALVDAVASIAFVPPLAVVLPRPGHPEDAARVAAGVDTDDAQGASSDPVLEKIRALLAKAESTTFDAEAAAFTAKAQELMARHAIDAALLEATSPTNERPVQVRLPIDAPYADVKGLLLQVVAEASRCRAVGHADLGLSTVIGFAADISAVEMLYTSLLVQAQTALAEAARHAPPGTRTRSQSYRSAFLLAYTERIGERLDEVNRAVVDAAVAEVGDSFLPVLADRSTAVDDCIDEAFGKLTSSRVRGGWDAAGWAGGRRAADDARLNAGDLATTTSASK